MRLYGKENIRLLGKLQQQQLSYSIAILQSILVCVHRSHRLNKTIFTSADDQFSTRIKAIIHPPPPHFTLIYLGTVLAALLACFIL